MKDLTLIIGASGVVGSELVKLLKAQGHSVRTTTSKKEGLTRELVHLNLVTGEGLEAAFENVQKAFLLSPAGYADQYAILNPLIREAKKRKLKKVVLMTAFGANLNESSPMRRAEIELEKSGLNYNIIRPNWFMQNFQTFWLHDINQNNKIRLPAGVAKTSFIDSRDISAVAAKLLTSDKFDRQAFDLTGPEAIDHAYVASVLSKVSGRSIVYDDIPPQDLKQDLIKAGLSSDYSDMLLGILGYLKAGYNSGLTSSVQDVTGVPPRKISQYANDYKNIWIK